MSGVLIKDTARNLMVLMVQASDHLTGLASLTLTITASKDGAAFASISPTVTDRGNGWYNLALTSSHTDTAGDLALHITGSSADPLDLRFSVELESLKPTTAGRKLDVSSGGEAGVDWANVGSPTTTVTLSGTTIKTATDVETDTADIQNRIPLALTAGGNIKADVYAMQADTVTSSSLATSAVTEIVAAIMAYAVDGTATVVGANRPMVALATGQATGLVRTGTAEYKKQGGTTAFSASQDVTAGTRAAATLGSGLDTP